MGAQSVRWDNCSTEPAQDCIYMVMVKEPSIIDGVLVHKGIMAADSVSDIKSHATQRGCHCGNTVLNVCSLTVDTQVTQK